MRLVFVGPPGAGKGTQSQWLTEHLAIPHLSTGDMLRSAIKTGSEVGRAAQAYLTEGQLVPDEVVNQIVAERLQTDDCSSGFLLDGFPRTLTQAHTLDQLLQQHNMPLDLVLELTAEPEAIIQRLVARGREDDTPDVIRRRIDVYRAETAPLVDFYTERGLLKSIDGSGTPREVQSRIQEIVDQQSSE